MCIYIYIYIYIYVYIYIYIYTHIYDGFSSFVFFAFFHKENNYRDWMFVKYYLHNIYWSTSFRTKGTVWDITDFVSQPLNHFVS